MSYAKGVGQTPKIHRLAVSTAVGGFELHVIEPAQPGARKGVIFAHGMGASAGAWLDHLMAPARRGVRVGVFDVPGHGARRGDLDFGDAVPVMDYLAVVDQAADESVAAASALRAMPDSTGEVGVCGFSMGGEIALVAAARDPQLSPIVVVGGAMTPRYLDAGDFPASSPDQRALDDAVRKIQLWGRVGALRDRPVVFFHGDHDDDAPPDEPRALADAIGPTALWHSYPGAHHPPSDAWDRVWSALAD